MPAGQRLTTKPMAAVAATAAPSERPEAPTPPGLTGDEWSEIVKSLPHDKIACLPATVAVVCIVVSLVAVGLRLYTRHRLLRNLGFDDVCVVLALLGVIALAVAVLIQTKYGLGTHAWDIQDGPHPDMYAKLLFIQITIYSASLLFIKLGISWQYYRIVKYDSRYRIPCIFVICAVVGWSIATMFAMVFICNPAEEFWLLSSIGKCDFQRGTTVAVGNIVTDFVLVLVPMPMVFRLNVKTPQKFCLLGLFAIGLFAGIVSVLRLVHLPSDFDTRYSGARVAAWTQAEVATGVLGSCAMTLQPLIKHWGAKLGLAYSFYFRPSNDGGDQASYKSTLKERLNSRTNDSIGNSLGNRTRDRSLEGSETELTRINDADETESIRRVETQAHIGLTQMSPTLSQFGPSSPGAGGERRRSRHDLDPRGLTVLAQTHCRAGPGGDDTPPATAVADEGREKTGRRSSQLGIRIKRAWSVREHRYDEGQ